MKKIYIGIVCLFMTLVASNVAHAAEGDVWITPNMQEIGANTNFDIDVHIDTGGKNLGAFNMYLDFDASQVTIDEMQVAISIYANASGSITLDNNALRGFDRGSDTQNYMMLSNIDDINNGNFRFAGIHSTDEANGNNVHVITIHAQTTSSFTSGSSNFSLRVNELSDELGHALSTGGMIDGMIIASENVPIYRLYNTKTGAQLYTRGQSDRDKILSKYKDFEFTDGVPAFWASTTDNGTTPIYRLYNKKNGAQLYTRGEDDKNKILNKYKDFEFTDGVPAFYASLTPQSGLTPIYRLYNTRTGMQLYTRGEADKNKILSKYSDYEFTDGVPAFYAKLSQ